MFKKIGNKNALEFGEILIGFRQGED